MKLIQKIKTWLNNLLNPLTGNSNLTDSPREEKEKEKSCEDKQTEPYDGMEP